MTNHGSERDQVSADIYRRSLCCNSFMVGQIPPLLYLVSCFVINFSLYRNANKSLKGSFRLTSAKRVPGKHRTNTRPTIRLHDTNALSAVNSGLYDLSLEWNLCAYVVAASGDKTVIGSWIFAKSALDVGQSFQPSIFSLYS